ncbi:hypothetical protein KP509_29G064300 [Ceratopteris richardii]|uniref:DUF4408 domain-containing protein n=1 Tax=Ceratopteris richardii TaxID=49495 RepID=A0A8T2R8X4_CERRI|nr:hypothetical protein KP509_29G064300 [Ceratopteris richardii]
MAAFYLDLTGFFANLSALHSIGTAIWMHLAQPLALFVLLNLLVVLVYLSSGSAARSRNVRTQHEDEDTLKSQERWDQDHEDEEVRSSYDESRFGHEEFGVLQSVSSIQHSPSYGVDTLDGSCSVPPSRRFGDYKNESVSADDTPNEGGSEYEMTGYGSGLAEQGHRNHNHLQGVNYSRAASFPVKHDSSNDEGASEVDIANGSVLSGWSSKGYGLAHPTPLHQKERYSSYRTILGGKQMPHRDATTDISPAQQSRRKPSRSRKTLRGHNQRLERSKSDGTALLSSLTSRTTPLELRTTVSSLKKPAALDAPWRRAHPKRLVIVADIPEEGQVDGEEEVDKKAEAFIGKFYEKVRLRL